VTRQDDESDEPIDDDDGEHKATLSRATIKRRLRQRRYYHKNAKDINERRRAAYEGKDEDSY
jgi:hypothetical protein